MRRSEVNVGGGGVHRVHDDRISLLLFLFFQNEESGLIKINLEKGGCRIWTEFNVLRVGADGVFFWYHKSRELLDQLSNYQVMVEHSI
jgi:hypothetical protein